MCLTHMTDHIAITIELLTFLPLWEDILICNTKLCEEQPNQTTDDLEM